MKMKIGLNRVGLSFGLGLLWLELLVGVKGADAGAGGSFGRVWPNGEFMQKITRLSAELDRNELDRDMSGLGRDLGGLAMGRLGRDPNGLDRNELAMGGLGRDMSVLSRDMIELAMSVLDRDMNELGMGGFDGNMIKLAMSVLDRDPNELGMGGFDGNMNGLAMGELGRDPNVFDLSGLNMNELGLSGLDGLGRNMGGLDGLDMSGDRCGDVGLGGVDLDEDTRLRRMLEHIVSQILVVPSYLPEKKSWSNSNNWVIKRSLKESKKYHISTGDPMLQFRWVRLSRKDLVKWQKALLDNVSEVWVNKLHIYYLLLQANVEEYALLLALIKVLNTRRLVLHDWLKQGELKQGLNIDTHLARFKLAINQVGRADKPCPGMKLWVYFRNVLLVEHGRLLREFKQVPSVLFQLMYFHLDVVEAQLARFEMETSIFGGSKIKMALSTFSVLMADETITKQFVTYLNEIPGANISIKINLPSVLDGVGLEQIVKLVLLNPMLTQ
ncbi:hypothetical protein NEHOM01_2151 [Nematocida homosporus]|uniref:uncharacterized protein n=1 Tax=Nematocida homosporus TaxID=1912981 RepID=UPI00221FEA35|nr:uncharacterized protein NEHOM01_2151 [Nematocida homosporus]KAI5187401.1 hypothetical protein NEHOM01_2151 [Nematocida homosporus]